MDTSPRLRSVLSLQTRGQAYQKALYQLLMTVVGVVASIVIAGLLAQARDLFVIAYAIWLGLCVVCCSSSNPRGHNEEGWNGGRYVVYYDLNAWRRYVSAAGFVPLSHYYRPAGLPRKGSSG